MGPGPGSPERQGESQSPQPGESQEERHNRNVIELLQELRVAGLGVQVLSGFLVSLPFSNGFGKLAGWQRDLYLASLLLAVLATALLMGPVAYHRLVFRHGRRAALIQAANVMAIAGLAVVALAVVAAVTLVASFVAGTTGGVVLGALLGCLFCGLWFILPLARR